jgi:hypothetical protein
MPVTDTLTIVLETKDKLFAPAVTNAVLRRVFPKVTPLTLVAVGM